ncbi:PEP-CTERM putative exosortase interaction domain-containing protein [Rivularia sp. PCC 7116]|uniref:PEP-CTERM sorting domain-containing protein n=1 Tax=Rivularia sp. PCC 7116 TaxID=373994 RepID=UPI00029EE355|nr:PEP-CTERM sorting domain-containing protein [Rivularia sp. PCC 7116]AFY55897.1 PEP-CTERM putative exosortase interaction domain-containing protein [Rivularia sp. PCC 7116]
MKFKELGLVFASLAVSLVGIASSASSAKAASFFGEDLQHFGNPSSSDRVTDVPFASELENSFQAEQDFLNALGGASIGTVNFEVNEGFTADGDNDEDKNQGRLYYDLDVKTTDGSIVNMEILDENLNAQTPGVDDWKLRSSIEKTNGKANGGTNFQGGRYGISEEGTDWQENQFLNTNAGKDSSIVFDFAQKMSAFGFYGTDFERGGVMGVEFTLASGDTKYVSLGISDPETMKKEKNVDTIRGTAFYSGYIADSEADYFTQVRFDVSDTVKGTNDMVAFDRMTFAKAEVPEPTTGILALGAVVSGAVFRRRKKKFTIT